MSVMRVLRLPNGQELDLPAYATAGAAGLDLRAADEGWVRAGEMVVFPTGVAVSIPVGHEGQIRSRSGLAFRNYVFAFPGTIDADYVGEIKVMLENRGDDPFHVPRGTRIAQLVIAPVTRVEVVEAALPGTARGAGGFGSTGTT